MKSKSQEFAEVISSLSLVVGCEHCGSLLGEIGHEALAEGDVGVQLLERPESLFAVPLHLGELFARNLVLQDEAGHDPVPILIPRIPQDEYQVEPGLVDLTLSESLKRLLLYSLGRKRVKHGLHLQNVL